MTLATSQTQSRIKTLLDSSCFAESNKTPLVPSITSHGPVTILHRPMGSRQKLSLPTLRLCVAAGLKQDDVI